MRGFGSGMLFSVLCFVFLEFVILILLHSLNWWGEIQAVECGKTSAIRSQDKTSSLITLEINSLEVRLGFFHATHVGSVSSQ